MKKATFVFKNKYNADEETFEGATWSDVLDALNNRQNLECLIRHAPSMGTRKDVRILAGLKDFIERWREDEVTKADFANFDCKLSIGSFRCLSAEDEDGAVTFG